MTRNEAYLNLQVATNEYEQLEDAYNNGEYGVTLADLEAADARRDEALHIWSEF